MGSVTTTVGRLCLVGIIVGYVAHAGAIGPIEREILMNPAGVRSALATLTEPIGKHKQKMDICVYNITGGNPPGFTFTYKLIGPKLPTSDTENNGGHTHPGNGASRPIGQMQYQSNRGAVIGPIPILSACATPFEYLVPAVAGKISGELLVVIPLGWKTAWPEPFDDSYSSWKYIDTFNIRIPDLIQLPPSTDGSYKKFRNPDKNHLDADAFGIRSDAKANLESLAYEMKAASGSPISVNDISLPAGGLLDIQGNWDAPHNGHRYGAEADLNKTSGVDCSDTSILKGTVLKILPDSKVQTTGASGTRYGRLLCEQAGGIHIFLERASAPNQTPIPNK